MSPSQTIRGQSGHAHRRRLAKTAAIRQGLGPGGSNQITGKGQRCSTLGERKVAAAIIEPPSVPAAKSQGWVADRALSLQGNA